jgi:hypothetical protein
MNFITDLSSSKRAISVYDACFVIVNRYTKMTLYIFVTKKIIVVDLIEMIFDHVILKFEALKDVVFDKKFVFTSAY